MFGIGVDIGGTNTDAVLLRFPNKTIISHTKTNTTKDFQSGVFTAINQVLSS